MKCYGETHGWTSGGDGPLVRDQGHTGRHSRMRRKARLHVAVQRLMDSARRLAHLTYITAHHPPSGLHHFRPSTDRAQLSGRFAHPSTEAPTNLDAVPPHRHVPSTPSSSALMRGRVSHDPRAHPPRPATTPTVSRRRISCCACRPRMRHSLPPSPQASVPWIPMVSHCRAKLLGLGCAAGRCARRARAAKRTCLVLPLGRQAEVVGYARSSSSSGASSAGCSSQHSSQGPAK